MSEAGRISIIRQQIRQSACSAFIHTIPIFMGFLFLGMTFGILMTASGFPAWMAVFMSVIIFAGSMQFVCINLLQAPFNPLQAVIMTLVINARHIVYGLAMLERFKNKGWKKPYLIFAMCDETFSVNASVKPDKGMDDGWFLFFVSLFDQLYWIFGTAIGAFLGNILHFDTRGLDFVMTAMFVVIFMEQLKGQKKPLVPFLGLGISLLCLIIFGADTFMIPAICLILLTLILLKKQLEKRE